MEPCGVDETSCVRGMDNTGELYEAIIGVFDSTRDLTCSVRGQRNVMKCGIGGQLIAVEIFGVRKGERKEL